MRRPFEVRDPLSDQEWIERKGEEAKALGRPLFLQHRQAPGWSKPLPVYLAWCPDCEAFTVAHPAGYGRIHCRKCRQHWKVMTPRRFRDKVASPIFWLAPRVLILPTLLILILLLVQKCQ